MYVFVYKFFGLKDKEELGVGYVWVLEGLFLIWWYSGLKNKFLMLV